MLLTGTIVSVSRENNIAMAKVNANGVIIRVALALLPDAEVGAQVLVEGGVAISIITQEQVKEKQHVPRNSG
ncbi:MAG TPA: HypC/HybG/HupF family hydrogenase formation chaperone [Bacteroidota bacterium]|nr:HypC/HybG/HupF family hydrogenase formation chaperone [Bacteroidota bacterium]